MLVVRFQNTVIINKFNFFFFYLNMQIDGELSI